MTGYRTYAGFSGIELAMPEYDLGEGLRLRRTYAHLMAPFLMAFAPPGPGGYHPAPWSAARGGFGFDIHVELEVPSGIEQHDLVWLIAALIRVGYAPYAIVPVVADRPFAEIPTSKSEPDLRPLEIRSRIFRATERSLARLGETELGWVRRVWPSTARLMAANGKFASAFRAFDSGTITGKTSAMLLALWAAIEQIFAPSPGELRFRVASALASYLEPPGSERLALYRRILKLYDQRSLAAHTAKDVDKSALIETYVLARNALVKMIDEGRIPTKEDLEELVFAPVMPLKPLPEIRACGQMQ